MDGNGFEILGLAGSIRRASLHRGLVRAAKELAPEGVTVEPYEELERSPSSTGMSKTREIPPL